MPTDRSLAVAQAALVNALTDGGQLPAGFDADRLRAATRVLLRKRIHAVAHACPALAEELGARFGPLFTEYARATPHGGAAAVADASRFIRWLRVQQPLPDGLRVAAVHLSLQRGARVAITWLPGARRVVAGVRFPAMRPRLLSARM